MEMIKLHAQFRTVALFISLTSLLITSPTYKCYAKTVQDINSGYEVWQVRTSNIYNFRVTMDELVLEINNACSISDNDIDLIALVTMAEAEGESELGKRRVIDTILNRFESDLFPDSIEDVIYQKNQFTSMWNGRIEKCYIDDTIRQLVVEELDCRRDDKVIYFTAGWYGKYGTPTYRVGHHYFSYR